MSIDQSQPINFLRRREAQLERASDELKTTLLWFYDGDKLDYTEFKDFAERVKACFAEVEAIRSAIRAKADELGGAS